MQGWADSPEQGGLGLAARPPMQMARPSLGDHLAQQMFPGADLNWMQKNRLTYGATSPEFMQQRQQLAQQLDKQEEDSRQHDLQLLEKAMTSKNPAVMMKALSQNQGYRFQKQAGQLSRTFKDADYGAIQTYAQYLPKDFQQRFIKGEVDDWELGAMADEAREHTKTNAKEKAKSQAIHTALNKQKAGQELDAYEQQLVDERNEGLADKEAKRFRDNAAAYKDLDSLNHRDDKDHSVLNRIHMAQNQGKPYSDGTPQSMNAALQEYKTFNPEGRRETMLGTPAPVKERSNIIDRKEFTKTGKLVLPPRGVTEGQLRSGDYTEITDKQKEAWGEIENSGVTLKSLFSMVEPLIKAQTPAQALKQYGQLSLGAVSKKNAAAATYLADSEAFSSRMARVFGSEVGVLTQGDVERWKRALPTFGDTVAVKDMKKKVFFDIYDQSRAMAVKKIAGEDISKDVVRLQATLNKVDKINPPSLAEDFNTLMGK